MIHRFALVVLTLIALPTPSALAAERPAERPNVVLIMTDNHGAWTLGCYGNKDIRTPHIDRLASEGTLMTRAYASNPVCSPTRATFLTGLLPSQHGVHCFLRGGRLQTGPDARNTLAEFTSLPELLKADGYRCGLVGKWHLGGNMQPQEGMDDYWITTPHGGTQTFYNAPIIENGQQRKEPKYLTEFWTDHAVKFIEQQHESAQNESADRPFFLFLAYNGPYALSRLLLREGKNRHAAYYADKELPSFPREPTHPWQFSNRDYINNPVSIRRVATEVSGIDDGVGRVMDALKAAGVDDNTLVVFTADQGWVGGQGGFWGMGDHTRPVTAFDGMMRIPMIFHQPGHVGEGQRSDALVSNYDFLPTMLGLLDKSDDMPTEPQSPGRDFSDVLKVEGDSENAAKPQAIFYEFEYLRCIRTEDRKYVHRHPHGPHELYDLKHDPDERTNLFDHPAHAATLARLQRRLTEFYDEYASPKYDLYHDGGSQTVLFNPPEKVSAVTPAAQAQGLRPLGFERSRDFHLPDGYTIEQAAVPGLVEHPMMADFDDRGRLYVAESAGLNLRNTDLEEQLPNSIRRLEDTDGDGTFDRATTFADKMTLPMGALWHDGSLFVASPPNIWKLTDTDDDGVADQREVLVGKFGYNGNAASIHGCFLHPDGRIYWCDGRHGHEFKDDAGNLTSQKKGSYIISCKPDGSDIRLHCGGGMDNPVEVDFTESGDVIGTVNILYRNPRQDCLVHWLHGGAYPHSERVLGEFKQTGDLLGPIHKFGHVAVSGMLRYRSGVLDRSFRDDWFVTIFNTGKLLRCEVTESGSTYAATQHEFLSCDDRDFHPTDVLEDADGSLLLVDTGGWFRIGCPTSQLAKPDVKGGIYRIRREGMTPLFDPFGTGIDWEQESPGQLMQRLNDTRWKVRERAIAECARRGDEAIPLLTQRARNGEQRVQRNALWALIRIGTEPARKVIRSALSADSATARAIACHGLGTLRDEDSVEALVKRLRNDESAHVRRAAATALGQIGDADASLILLGALSHAVDRAEEHALIYAVLEIDEPGVQWGIDSDDPRVLRGALIALDQMDDKLIQTKTVFESLRHDNSLLRKTALDIICRHPEWSQPVADLFRSWINGHPSAPRDEAIARLTTTFAMDPAVAEVIGLGLSAESNADQHRSMLLAAIAQGSHLPLHASWRQPLQSLLDSYNADTLQQTIAAVSAIDSDVFDERLQALAAADDVVGTVRLAATEAALRRNRKLSDAGFEMLTAYVGDEGSPRESARAAQLISRASLSQPQLRSLALLLDDAGPLNLRELIKPYRGIQDAPTAEAFFTALADSKSFTSLNPVEFSDIIKTYPAELLPRANSLLGKLHEQQELRIQRLDALQSSLDAGDIERGRALYFAEKSKCSTCHRVGDKGGKIGPDLSGIGKIRTSRDLLEAIVFPSVSFAREYEPYTVLTDDGRAFSGLIARETNERLYLQQQTGEPIALDRDAIDSITPATISIMPQGLDKTMTERDVADLVAYLRTLRSVPGERGALAP